jgi:hypothetical protein
MLWVQNSPRANREREGGICIYIYEPPSTNGLWGAPPPLWALRLFCNPIILMIKKLNMIMCFLYILCKGNTNASTFVHFAKFFPKSHSLSRYFEYYFKFYPHNKFITTASGYPWCVAGANSIDDPCCPASGIQDLASIDLGTHFVLVSINIVFLRLLCIPVCFCTAGYNSTDLRLYTSTKLKIVNYWLYSPMYKK